MESNSVPGGSLVAHSRRAEELAYVTEHFHDMQGMAGAPLILMLFLFGLWERACGFGTWQLWFLLAGMVLSLGAAMLIQRWYRKSFGFVTAPKQQPSSVLSIVNAPISPSATVSSGQASVSWILLILYLALCLPHRSDRHVASLSFLSSTYVLLLPRCFYRTPSVAILQLRRMLSIATMAILHGVIIAGLWITESRWVVIFAVLGSFLLIVLYDHWLLMRLLGGCRRTEAFDAE